MTLLIIASIIILMTTAVVIVIKKKKTKKTKGNLGRTNRGNENPNISKEEQEDRIKD